MRSEHPAAHAAATELLLTDLITAETIYVLESFYETPRAQIAEAMRSLLAFDTIVYVDLALLLRAIEVYEVDRIDFAEAYLVACAESTDVSTIASFDRSLDRVTTVTRLEPPAPQPRVAPNTPARNSRGHHRRSQDRHRRTRPSRSARHAWRRVRSGAASKSPSGPIGRGEPAPRRAHPDEQVPCVNSDHKL